MYDYGLGLRRSFKKLPFLFNLDFHYSSVCFQVIWDFAVGSNVPRVHALPWSRQPGSHAVGDQRRPPGAAQLLPGPGLRPHVSVLASNP